MRYHIDLHVETKREGSTVVASLYAGPHRLGFDFDGVVRLTEPERDRDHREAVRIAMEKFAARLNEVLAVRDAEDW